MSVETMRAREHEKEGRERRRGSCKAAKHEYAVKNNVPNKQDRVILGAILVIEPLDCEARFARYESREEKMQGGKKSLSTMDDHASTARTPRRPRAPLHWAPAGRRRGLVFIWTMEQLEESD